MFIDGIDREEYSEAKVALFNPKLAKEMAEARRQCNFLDVTVSFIRNLYKRILKKS